MDLQFRTLESSGILLYNAGRRGDFFALELNAGRVRAVLDLGDGPIILESKGSSSNPLNDNRWHSVHLRRPAPNVHSLEVDDKVDLHTSTGMKKNHLQIQKYCCKRNSLPNNLLVFINIRFKYQFGLGRTTLCWRCTKRYVCRTSQFCFITNRF